MGAVNWVASSRRHLVRLHPAFLKVRDRVGTAAYRSVPPLNAVLVEYLHIASTCIVLLARRT